MPFAPRPSRKGGKIFSPIGPTIDDGTPVVISPATLLPGTTPCSLPCEPGNGKILEFDFEGIFAAKKPPNASTTNSTGSHLGPDANVLKFDFEALQKVAQGEVIGSKKNIRTGTKKPETALETVEAKLAKLLEAQAGSLAEQGDAGLPCPALSELEEDDVVLVDRPYVALTLAVVASTALEGGKVLVVVPHYYEVSSAAKCLSYLQTIRGTPGSGVGELCGQLCKGPAEARLWVCNADTALVYLHTEKCLEPFRFVVVPCLSRLNPTVSYFLWSLREWVYGHSPHSVAPTRYHQQLVLCALPGDQESVQQFFAKRKTRSLCAAPGTDWAGREFSYDEASALAEMEVLEVGVDSSRQCPTANQRVVSHILALATNVVGKIIDRAKHPQRIYLFTAQTQTVAEALQTKAFANMSVVVGQFTFETLSSASAAHHQVFVTSFVPSFLYAEHDRVDWVLDFGTTRRLSPQNKSESFMVGSLTEWVSRREVQQRRAVLTPLVGGYVILYPPTAAAGFALDDAGQAAMVHIEDALLQCNRAQLPAMLASDVLTPSDPDRWDQARYNLRERRLLTDAPSTQLTFLGEFVSRLPLGLDLGCFVLNGCAAGLSEATVVIAAVGALPFVFASGNSPTEREESRRRVLEQRRRYADEVARQSDVLADSMMFLAWARRKARCEDTAELIQELQVEEWRLERIQALIDHLQLQLSDYTFMDSLQSAATLEATTRTIQRQSTMLVFLLAAALARKAAFVHDAGQLKVKDRSATLTFVRTSKKAVPNLAAPTSIPWEIGAAVVALDFRNTPSTVLASRFSAINTNYLFAVLLLLYPEVEYSAPMDVAHKGRVVHFSITCNRQIKRFRVSIDEAARILDCRERWNIALGALQALRLSHRPISYHRFQLALKEEDRCFDLQQFYTTLQHELLRLVTETEITEHQVSFTTLGVHCLAPKELLHGLEPTEAGDVLTIRRFRSGELWQSGSPLAATTAASDSPPLDSDALPNALNALGPVIEDDQSEIEFLTDNYFLSHRPIEDN